MLSEQYKYWAFISYSHQDKTWGDWLHKTLETYRIPPKLVGRRVQDYVIPKRLFPIFRDREELPTSADLSSNINEALKQSRYLVVICSPKSAVSRWVNEEIKSFKRLGRENQILAMVVDGEPNASDYADSGALECFPVALRHRISPDGTLAPERVEPIAADARPGNDGRHIACLKVLAGLLGLPFDELRQRDRQRRRQLWLRNAAAALIGTVLIVSTGIWLSHERDAQFAIAKYTEQGRQLFITGKPLQAAVYLAQAYSLGGRAPSLRFLLARCMRYVDALRPLKADDDLEGLGELSQNGRFRIILNNMIKPKLITTVSVLDTSTHKVTMILPFPGDIGVSAIFSPDSTRLLTEKNSTDMDSLQIWDVLTGKLVASLHGSHLDVAATLFSPDGRLVASSTGVWTATTGALLAQFNGRSGHNIEGVAISPDDKTIAYAVRNHGVQVWDLQSRRLRYAIVRTNITDIASGHLGNVFFVTFTNDGTRLLTAGDDDTVRVWEAENGKPRAVIPGPVGGIAHLSMSPDGRLLALSSDSNSTELWDINDYTMRGTLPSLRAYFTFDSKRMVTDGGTSNETAWDIPTFSRAVEDTKVVIRAVASDESRIAAMDGNTVHIFGLANGDLQTSITLPRNPDGQPVKLYDIALSPDLNRLVAVDRFNNELTLWNATSSRQIAVLGDRHGALETYAFDPDGSRLFTCGSDHIGVLWDSNTGTEMKELTREKHCVSNMRFNGHELLEPPPEIMNSAPTSAYSSEGGRLATADKAGLIKIWDTNGFRLLSSWDVSGPIATLAFSPDGHKLTTLQPIGKLKTWDVDTGQALWVYNTDIDAIHTLGYISESMQYSADGNFVLLEQSNVGPSILDAQSGQLLLHINPVDATPNQGSGGVFVSIQAQLSGHGSYLVTQDFAAPSLLWDMHLEARLPSAISNLITCYVPWVISQGRLMPAKIKYGACH